MSKVEGLKTGTFCRVQDSAMAEHGVKKGDLVYIAGDGYVRTDPDDPYVFRQMFVASWMEDQEVIAEKGGFTIDGKRLKAVSKPLQAKLEAKLEAKYRSEENASDEATH